MGPESCLPCGRSFSRVSRAGVTHSPCPLPVECSSRQVPVLLAGGTHAAPVRVRVRVKVRRTTWDWQIETQKGGSFESQTLPAGRGAGSSMLGGKRGEMRPAKEKGKKQTETKPRLGGNAATSLNWVKEKKRSPDWVDIINN